jgi:hypothetical protein
MAEAHEHSAEVFVLLEQASAVAELVYQHGEQLPNGHGRTLTSAAGALSTLLRNATTSQDRVVTYLIGAYDEAAKTVEVSHG